MASIPRPHSRTPWALSGGAERWRVALVTATLVPAALIPVASVVLESAAASTDQALYAGSVADHTTTAQYETGTLPPIESVVEAYEHTPDELVYV
jgi:hypothetical protein